MSDASTDAAGADKPNSTAAPRHLHTPTLVTPSVSQRGCAESHLEWSCGAAANFSAMMIEQRIPRLPTSPYTRGDLRVGDATVAEPQPAFRSTRPTLNSASSASAILSNVGRLGEMFPPSRRAIADCVVPDPFRELPLAQPTCLAQRRGSPSPDRIARPAFSYPRRRSGLCARAALTSSQLCRPVISPPPRCGLRRCIAASPSPPGRSRVAPGAAS